MGSDNSGSTTLIALVVGALLVLVIGLYASGAFNARQDTTSITVDTPTVTAPAAPSEPAPAPETTPPAPEPAPAEPAPQ